MKKLFLSALLFLSASASLLAETTSQEFNPLTGKFDLITVVSSSTLPSGSTFYIQNTNTLQDGSTFYVSSGTVKGDFVVSDNTTSPTRLITTLTDLPRNGGFGPQTVEIQLLGNVIENSGVTGNLIIAASTTPFSSYTTQPGIIINPYRGNESIGFVGNSQGLGSDMDVTQNGFNLYRNRETRYYDSDSSNYVSFRSSGTVSSNVAWVLPSADASPGRALITNGLGVFSLGLSSAASNSPDHQLLMADANKSITPADGFQLDFFPGFTGAVTAFSNFFALSRGGVGYGGPLSLFDTDISAAYNIYPAPVTNYDIFEINPGSTGTINQVKVTGGGNPYTMRWETPIFSTGTLQSGATFYVSSGTVSGQLSVNSIKWPDGTIQVSSPSAGGGGSGFTNAVNVAQFTSTRVHVVGGTTLEKSLIGFGIGSTTFTANTFTKGYTFRIKAMGHFERATANSVFRFKFAGLDVADSGSQVLGASGNWTFDSLVTIQSTGTNGSFISQSYFFPQPTGSDTMYGLIDLSTSAINTTISNYVDLTLTFDVNDSTVTVTNFLIDSLVVSTNTLGMSPGATYYIQNTDVLQTGATFYVSSGTVTNVSVTTITFNDASKLATAPEKEYWWPGAATMPLEATADSIAAASISTGTNFDVMEASFDSATDECRQVSFFVSTNSLVSVSTVTFGVRWFSLTTTTGNTGWYFKHNSGVRSGESWDQTPQAHSSSFDAVGGTARIVTHTEWDVAVSSLTWRGGDVVQGGFCRDADNGSDTMSGDAKAEGFWIRFKRQ